MSEAKNVTVGKPKAGGAVFVGAAGSTLPATADAKLDAAFKEIGYLSEDGITNSNSPETDNIKAWGGDVVATTQSEKPDTFKLTLIETLKSEVLKVVYGDDNVTVGEDGAVSVKANNAEAEAHAWVFDMILKDGALKRIVIPQGKISEIGDITYNDSDLVGYEVTITCVVDGSGNTHYEYIKPAA